MYYITEGKENDIKICENNVKIIMEDFSYINNPDKFIIKLIESSSFLIALKPPLEVMEELVKTIIEDKDINEFHDVLIENNYPLFSLVLGFASSCKNKYDKLKKFKDEKKVIFKCNRDNFIKVIELSNIFNKEIIIDGVSISLTEYKELLKDYNVDNISNVRVHYLNYNSSITLKELLELSNEINKITDNINKYNLSSLEKIIYVYDIVKKRKYKRSDNNKLEERDVDKVIKGDFIVCSGYSNLFNVYLENLGIKATSFFSVEKKHQRSLVYIDDKKYNINGVYVFDPTWDSNKDDEYINNYNYFGLTLDKVKCDTPNDMTTVYDTSFKKIKYMYDNISIKSLFDDIVVIEEIEKMFNFIDEKLYSKFDEMIKLYDFYSEEEQSEVEEIYNSIIGLYSPKVIGYKEFMHALYNTRLIEYYSGMIDEVDLDMIVDTVIDMASFQKFHYIRYTDMLKRAYDMIGFESKLYEELENVTINDNDVLKRMNLNVRLLKILRKKMD